MEEEKDISQAKKEYSWGSEIIVNLDEMRCSWSNAPQPITSTAADTGGHVDRVHLDASLCWIRMERLFHSGFFVWCSTDLPCSTGTRAGSYSGSRGVLERDGQTPCT